MPTSSRVFSFTRRLRAALTVAAMLTLPATLYAADWQILSGQNVVIIGDQTAGRLKDFALQLEQFRNAVAAMIPSARQLSRPTTVALFSESRTFQPYLPMRNGRRVNAAGVCQSFGDAVYMIASVENLDSAMPILFHEYTHMLLSTGNAPLPAWLSEGTAEYFSTFQLSSGNRRATIGLAPARRIAVLARQTLVSVSQLIKVDHSSPLYNEEDRQSIFYSESWALVHYIVAELPDGMGAINRYVGLLNQGMASEQAFTMAFGGTPAMFDRKLQEYTKQVGFKAWTLTFREPLKGDASQEQPRRLDQVEAEARLAGVQLRLAGVRDAGPRIEKLAQGATTAEPFLALGGLRLAQNKPREAIEAFSKAATLEPDDFSAQYEFGEALLRHQADAKEAGVANPVDVALAALRKATTLNPNAAEAHYLLSVGYNNTRRYDEAANALEPAITLAPGRLDYRMLAATVLANQGNTETARKVLNAIMALDPDGPLARTARERLQQLDDRDRRATNATAGGGNPVLPGPALGGAAVTYSTPSRPRVRYDLRRPAEGETKAFGELLNVECANDTIKLHMKSGPLTIIAGLKRFEDLDIVTFRENQAGGTFGCGVRPADDRVYLTWRRSDARIEGTLGDAIAIEFMPEDFVP